MNGIWSSGRPYQNMNMEIQFRKGSSRGGKVYINKEVGDAICFDKG